MEIKGKINKRKKFVMRFIMLFAIFFACLSLINASVDSNLYYKLKLKYSYGKININSAEMIFSQDTIGNFFKNDLDLYSFEIKNINNDVLKKEFFSVPNMVIYDIGNETEDFVKSEVVFLNESDFEIFAPYYENSEEIVIYDKDNKEIAKIDVTQYSKQLKEDIGKAESEVESEESKTSEKSESIGDKFNKFGGNFYIYLIIIIIFILIVFIIITNKPKRKRG